MASWFNPDSNSMKGGPGSASVGGPKQFDLLGGLSQAFGNNQNQTPPPLSQSLASQGQMPPTYSPPRPSAADNTGFMPLFMNKASGGSAPQPPQQGGGGNAGGK